MERAAIQLKSFSFELGSNTPFIVDVGGYSHEVPFEGLKKESGIGREGGRRGIEEYMEEKSIVANLSN